MKKIIYLFLLFCGCSTTNCPTDRRVVTHLYDFREYAENDFFISTGEYHGKFMVLADIDIDIRPATIETRKKETDNVSYGEYDVSECKTEEITGDEIIRMMHDKAREMGADGITNLRINEEYFYWVGTVKTRLFPHIINVRALFIKRLD